MYIFKKLQEIEKKKSICGCPEKIDGVAATSTWMIEIAEAGYKGTLAPVELMGGDPADIRGFLGGTVELAEGRLIKEGAHREAILSTSTLEHINRWLDSDLKVNDVLILNGIEFTIVGVMAYDLAGVEVRACDEINCAILRRIFVHNQGVEIGA